MDQHQRSLTPKKFCVQKSAGKIIVTKDVRRQLFLETAMPLDKFLSGQQFPNNKAIIGGIKGQPRCQ